MSAGESEPAITQLLAVMDLHAMAPGINSGTWSCIPRKIVRDRQPQFRATVNIRSDVGKRCLVEVEDCESAIEIQIISVLTQNHYLTKVGQPGDFRESISQRKVLQGKKRYLFEFDLSTNLLHFMINLKIYASSKLPLSTLEHALNEARIRGDPQCDAFLCVEGVELPAHRLVLAAQSDVFSKMFDGNFKEALNGRVFLKDTTKKAAEQLLEYLYTGTGDFEGVELELLDMAERYALNHLKKDCMLRLSTVSGLRALELLQTPNPHIKSMESILLRLVCNSWDSVKKTRQYTEFKTANSLLAGFMEVSLNLTVFSSFQMS